MLIANSKRFGREQIQIHIPALCPRVLDLPNTCPFSKVTLACGTFPYLSRALPSCFGVNYIHKNRLMEPWGLESMLICMCVCLPPCCGIVCVFICCFICGGFGCGLSELCWKRKNSPVRGRGQRKSLLTEGQMSSKNEEDAAVSTVNYVCD